MKDKYYNDNKDIYRRMFLFLAEKTTIDYAVNLEQEYGMGAVVEEAYDRGFGL